MFIVLTGKLLEVPIQMFTKMGLKRRLQTESFKKHTFVRVNISIKCKGNITWIPKFLTTKSTQFDLHWAPRWAETLSLTTPPPSLNLSLSSNTKLFYNNFWKIFQLFHIIQAYKICLPKLFETILNNNKLNIINNLNKLNKKNLNIFLYKYL